MSKGVSDKITYKLSDQGQAYLIPPRMEELIPANHLVRLVSEVIGQMGIERLLRKYQVGGGASRYHPEMITKLFVYGYMTNGRWLRLKRNTKKALQDERYIPLRERRPVEEETIFGKKTTKNRPKPEP
jgi:hypothetical protein